MLNQAIKQLVEERRVQAELMQSAMREIMAGGAGEAELAAFLTGLRVKGESAEELAAAVEVLREHMLPLPTPAGWPLLDTCGTGGDGLATFNISTTVALVLAACGVPVVKHGNRGVSSSSGSADVLSTLGVKIDAEPAVLLRCLSETGIAFCFAPRFHPAMRHVAEVRKRLGFRTLFNLMGPLANPARAQRQLIGVGKLPLLDLLADTLARLGIERAFLVHGEDGMDEITLAGETVVREVVGHTVHTHRWHPSDFGLKPQSLDSLKVKTPAESATKVRAILVGETGAGRDIVLVNAAAGLVLAGKSSTLSDAVKLAANAIDQGRADALLQKLAQISQQS
jgi:anthranilate phosphoribosyltransferase